MPTFEPLTRDQVASVIEGRSAAPRVPANIHFWVHCETFGEREQAVRDLLSRYPADFQQLHIHMPGMYEGTAEHPEYRWVTYDDPYEGARVAHDARIAMADWSRLDEILANFPDPSFPGLLEWFEPADGQYRLGMWWFCLFERHWSLRGMTNALTDYYTHAGEVHRLFRALTDFYVAVIGRVGRQGACDGILTSDDVGMQTGPFFSPEIFREFFKPYYREIIDAAHAEGMHLWLHACGNIEPFIADLIDAGLDVLHPIQKHTMDERAVADQYGRDITIFAGMDVQQTIPWGTPEDVRAEVRFLIDTFWRPGEGRCMITAGNVIHEDCTLASLEAFLDETYTYGQAKVGG